MRMRNLLPKVLLLMAAMLTGASTAWADTTYKLEKVTSVTADGLYVFEQGGYVMNNTISNDALQTTNSYKTTGLTGTETYVWKLIASGTNFKMMNVSLEANESAYLANSSKTNVSFNTGGSSWKFTFQTDGTALIQNPNNSNRFLGYQSSTSYVYKAYANSNLSSYPHAIVVYKLTEETGGGTTTVATPTFSPAAGAVAYNTTVTISAASGCILNYTVDGTDPSTSSTATMTGDNTATVSITAATTIRAIAIDADLNESSEASAAYTIAAPAAPVFSPAAGKVDAGTEVTLSADVDMIIYTTDGTEPSYESDNGEIYTGAIAINEATTFKAIAVDDGGNESEVVTAVYTIKKAASGIIDLRSTTTALTFSPGSFTSNGNGYQSYNDVTFTGNDGNDYSGWTLANVMKSANNMQMRKSDGKVTMPTIKTDGGFTIKVTAVTNSVIVSDGTHSGTNELEVSSTDANITISTGSVYAVISQIEITPTATKTVAAPTFSVADGNFFEAQSVTLSCETAGAEIYYTLDGTNPSKESTKYTGAINVSQTTTIKAIAYVGDDDSNVSSVTLTFPTVYQNMAELISANLSSNSKAYLKFTNAQVYYVDGKFMYIGDASASLCFYNTGLTYTAGQRLNGTALVTYTVYHKLPEVTTVEENNLTVTNGEPTSVVMAVEDVDASKASTLVEISGTISNPDGNQTAYIGDLKIYDNFNNGLVANLAAGDNVVIKGIVLVHDDDLEVAPISLDVTKGTVEVTIGSLCYLTYANTTNAISFNATGVKAYTAKLLTNSVELTEVDEIPANTAVILKAETAGEYTLNIIESAAAVENNDLLVSDGTITGGDNIFCLANGNNGVGFYRVDTNVTIPAGKCYLEIPAQQGAARQFIGFGHGETTGIETVAADCQQGQVYDLQGRRIAHPVKGLYIVNGKKYVK